MGYDADMTAKKKAPVAEEIMVSRPLSEVLQSWEERQLEHERESRRQWEAMDKRLDKMDAAITKNAHEHEIHRLTGNGKAEEGTRQRPKFPMPSSPIGWALLLSLVGNKAMLAGLGLNAGGVI